MEIRQWVEKRYRHPVVLVFASLHVENSCRRNGMDFIHMLRPYSIHNGELFAHVGDRSDVLPVRNFGVRFVRPQCVREVSQTQIDSYFRELLRDNVAIELAYGEQLDRAMSSLLNNNGGVVERPQLSSQVASQLLERSYLARYTQFIREYAYLVRCSHFDTIDHPIGCIYAASTQETGGISGVLRVFSEQEKQPQETRRDMPCMDEELHSYYILVHDMTKGPSIEEVKHMFTKLQAHYGHINCALVRINSVDNPQNTKNMDPSFWIEANMPFLDVPAWINICAANNEKEQGGKNISVDAMKGQSASDNVVSISNATSSIIGNNHDNNNNNNSNNNSSHSINNNTTLGNGDFKAGYLHFPRLQGEFGTWPNGTPKITGCYLTPENVSELRNVMTYYLSHCLFNFVERKLRSLTVTVNERRTTTLGKMAAWFRNKDEVKSGSEGLVVSRVDGQTRYLARSLEMQMRRAGDLLLALSDYDLAMHFYRMCRNELLSTLSSRKFNKPLIAACQEGIGICSLLQSHMPLPSMTPWTTGGTDSKSSGDCRLEIARNDYIASNIKPYSLRLSFLLYEYCRTRSPPAVERSLVLLKHMQRVEITASNKLYTAFVYELIASALIFLNPSQPAGLTIAARIPEGFLLRSHIRQYAHYMIVAGGLYIDENLFENSLRCYLRALCVFGGVGRRGNWQCIFEHLFSRLAHVYHMLGNQVRGVAMLTFPLLIGAPMYSNPKIGLRNFEIFWNYQRQLLKKLNYAVSPHMLMPCVVPGSIRVSIDLFHCDEVTKCESHSIGDQLMETEWRVLEHSLSLYYTKACDISSCHFFSWKDNALNMQRVNLEKEKGKTKKKEERGTKRIQKYFMRLAEPLEISVTLRNPIGGAIKAEDLCLLYVSKNKPDQLWKSTSTQSVELGVGESKSVIISFSPANEGVYIIIGFCWKLMGLEGYYYFATEDRELSNDNSNNNNTVLGFFPSSFEYAVEKPKPDFDSPGNLEIEVGPSHAWITAKLNPELPHVMRDGEYYQTTLVLTNNSPYCVARNITLQRSHKNAHLVWFDAFGLENNMDNNATFLLEKELGPKCSVTLPLTIQPHHCKDNLSFSNNYIFFLLGYIDEVPKEKELAVSSSSSSFSATSVRLHRFFRRVEVKPVVFLSSMVLPPANKTMASAVLVTVNNASETREPPVRVSRVMAIFKPRWRVFPIHLGDLLNEENVDGCILPPGGALSIPLSVVSQAPSKMTTSATATSQQSELVEEVCIPLPLAFPAPQKCALVEANIGSSIVNSLMNFYFMRRSFCGPGEIGEANISCSLSFYLDGKSALAKRRSSLTTGVAAANKCGDFQQEENLKEKGLLVSDVDPLTPICVAVVWVVEENGYLYSGQVFHFVDPVIFLYPENTLVGEAHEKTQENLCNSMITNNNIHTRNVAMFYHVEVPYSVTSTAAQPDVVMIPLTIHCHSLAVFPLLVTLKAVAPGCPNTPISSVTSMSFTFVGKTSCMFLLLPYETHLLTFTACVFVPGVVDCNSFELSAVALKPSSLFVRNGKKLYTGMSSSALLDALGCEVYSSQFDMNIMPTTSKKVEVSEINSQKSHIENHSRGITAISCDEIQVKIIGYGVAAITRAVFLNASADVLSAAAEATASRMLVYNDDARVYEAKYKEFVSRKALLEGSSAATSNNTESEFAIYRPLGRKLTKTTGNLSHTSSGLSANVPMI